MKIGFISDTHGDLNGWQRAFEIFGQCDYIIHSGDILNPGPFNPLPESFNPLELAKLINESKTPVLVAKGNCDSEVDTLAINLPIQSPYLFFRWENLTVLAQHGHLLQSEEFYKLASIYDTSIAVSGHTHIYSLKRKNSLVMLNPGSPSIPKGAQIPTVALLDSDILSIIDLTSGNELEKIDI